MKKSSTPVRDFIFPKIRMLILVGGVVVLATPLWWMLITSFDESANMESRFPPSLWFNTGKLGTFNFQNVLDSIPILRFYMNTVFITFVIVIIQIFFCSMAGYAFAKGRFPGRQKLFIVFLATMMIPFQLYMIPLYLMMNKIGLVNTYWALILPGMQNAYGVFLVTQYIKTIPDELIEAARVDGASEFRIFFFIIFPLAKPVTATLAVLTALWTWNDFLWPYLVLLKQDLFTITLGVSMFQQQYKYYIGNIVAVSLMAILPIVILYFFLQKYVISGITMGGTKY